MAVRSYREHHEQGPSSACSPDCDKAILLRGMLGVWRHPRTTSKQGLDFRNSNPMLLALHPVASVPIKPANTKRDHTNILYNCIYVVKRREAKSLSPSLHLTTDCPRHMTGGRYDVRQFRRSLKLARSVRSRILLCTLFGVNNCPLVVLGDSLGTRSRPWLSASASVMPQEFASSERVWRHTRGPRPAHTTRCGTLTWR